MCSGECTVDAYILLEDDEHLLHLTVYIRLKNINDYCFSGVVPLCQMLQQQKH